MRKFILSIVVVFTAVFSGKAQIATENSKLFDNTYVGVVGGAFTNLNFNSVFPLNSAAGLKIGKDLTPAFTIEAAGLAFFKDSAFNPGKPGTTVKATNVSLSGVLNWSNIFGGYNGSPRFFEVRTNTGLGWLHTWNTSTNNLTANTGFDLAFNLGNKRAHSIVLSPTIFWNLDQNSKIQFNKNNAQIGILASYVYHFKTSNGTHHFKTYDIDALYRELEDAKKNVQVNTVVTKETEYVMVPVESKLFVFFAQNNAELDQEAIDVLNLVPNGATVNIVGSASIEGTKEYNQKLSERRAKSVANYLVNNRSVKVKSTTGVGAQNNASGRIAVVEITQ